MNRTERKARTAEVNLKRRRGRPAAHLWRQAGKRLRQTGTAVGVSVLSLTTAVTAAADPPPPDPGLDPYPDIRYYDEVDPGNYASPGGVWFIAPTGQNCGIWGLGSFGCAGNIAGAPGNQPHRVGRRRPGSPLRLVHEREIPCQSSCSAAASAQQNHPRRIHLRGNRGRQNLL